jgi:ABC-type transport system involved in multi-copper enzyme maturation permease subunit
MRDASAPRPEPETKARSADAPRTEERRYWLVVAIHLAPMLLVGSIPFAVLLFVTRNDTPLEMFPIFVACWVIFALWITLAKGMDSMSREGSRGTIWLLLGLFNLIAAFGILLFVGR